MSVCDQTTLYVVFARLVRISLKLRLVLMESIKFIYYLNSSIWSYRIFSLYIYNVDFIGIYRNIYEKKVIFSIVF